MKKSIGSTRCFFDANDLLPSLLFMQFRNNTNKKGGMALETITAVHRNHFGDIISFVTSGGRVISYRKALYEAENGHIQGVQTTLDTDGNMALMPEPDQSFDQYPNLF